jgi:hypothetical protein
MPFSTNHLSETAVTGYQGKSCPAAPANAIIPVRNLQSILFSGNGQAVSVPVVQVLILVH